MSVRINVSGYGRYWIIVEFKEMCSGLYKERDLFLGEFRRRYSWRKIIII